MDFHRQPILPRNKRKRGMITLKTGCGNVNKIILNGSIFTRSKNFFNTKIRVFFWKNKGISVLNKNISGRKYYNFA